MDTPVHYSRSPLNEVVIGIQFSGVNWQIQHYGAYYEKLKKSYPKIQSVLPLAKHFEQPTLKFNSAAEMPRVWYSENTGPFLIQIQPDRFLLNWIKGDKEANNYPHFDAILKKFGEEYTNFVNFCMENRIGEAIPEFYELTYINHLSIDDSWKTTSDLSNYFIHFDFVKSFPDTKLFGVDLGYVVDGFPVKHSIKKGKKTNTDKDLFIMDFSVVEPVKNIAELPNRIKKANSTLGNEFDRLTTKFAKEQWGRS